MIATMTLTQWIGAGLVTSSLLVIAAAFVRGCLVGCLEADEQARTQLLADVRDK